MTSLIGVIHADTLLQIPFMPNWIHAQSLPCSHHWILPSVTDKFAFRSSCHLRHAISSGLRSVLIGSVSHQAFSLLSTTIWWFKTNTNDKHMSELPWPVALQRPSCLIHIPHPYLIKASVIEPQRWHCKRLSTDCTVHQPTTTQPGTSQGKLPFPYITHQEQCLSMMIYSIYHDGLRSHKLDIDENAFDKALIWYVWHCFVLTTSIHTSCHRPLADIKSKIQMLLTNTFFHHRTGLAPVFWRRNQIITEHLERECLNKGVRYMKHRHMTNQL